MIQHKLLNLSLNRLCYWGGRLGFSIADQALTSGANFLLNIFLVKWFIPEEYGIFSIMFTIFLFLSGLHNSLLVEPAVVIGPSKFASQLSQYLIISIIIHLLYSLFMAFLLFGAGWIIQAEYDGITTSRIISIAVSNALILLFWLLRRTAYIDLRSKTAFMGSLIYSLALVIFVLIFYRFDWLNAENVFLLMSLASFIASGFLIWSLGLYSRDESFFDQVLSVQNILSEHWQYGRWILAGNFAYFLSTLAYLPLIGTFVGLAASGVLRAMQNLIQPLQQLIIALALFLLPWLSGQRRVYGDSYPLRMFPRILTCFGALGVSFLLPLTLFGYHVVNFIYANDYYEQFVWMLYFINVATILQIGKYSISVCLRASGDSTSIFWGELSGAVTVIVIGLILIQQFGLWGACISMMISAFIELLVMAWRFRRYMTHLTQGE